MQSLHADHPDSPMLLEHQLAMGVHLDAFMVPHIWRSTVSIAAYPMRKIFRSWL